VTETLERLLTDSPVLALFGVFWIGALASLRSCTVIRLPVVLAYVAGKDDSRRRSLLLTALFLLGLVLSYVLLGAAAAFLGGVVADLLHGSKLVFWATGILLMAAGVLASGIIGPGVLPQRWLRVIEKLEHVRPAGALVLGLLFGLLTMPACPICGAGIIVLAGIVTAKGLGLYGILMFLSFALGQGLPLVAIGVLTAIVRQDLVRWLRARMCSIDQRIQLFCGNLLIVLGIYLIVVG
jgi:cytochrome c biogenesis protein CcdA